MASLARQPDLSRIPEEPRTSQRPPSAASQVNTNFSRPRLYSPTPSGHCSPIFEDKSRSIENAFKRQLDLQAPKDLVPPPRNPLRQSAHQSWYDDNDAAPPPIVRTYADLSQPKEPVIDTRSPQTWSYKAYAASTDDSDTTSVLTDETDESDMTSTDDCESFTDDTSSGVVAVDDYQFDGRLGWRPAQKPSQLSREQQQWATPRTGPQTLQQQKSQKARALYPEPRRHERKEALWHGEGSRDLSPIPPPPWPQSGGPVSVKDVFEIAADQYESRQVRPAENRPMGAQRSMRSLETGPTPWIATSHQIREEDQQISPALSRLEAGSSSSTRPPTALTPTSTKQEAGEGSGLSRSDSFATGSASVSSISSGEWRASNHDLSRLSPAKLKRLEAKGINPALYLEMKMAKKGQSGKRRFGGVLTANSFLV